LGKKVKQGFAFTLPYFKRMVQGIDTERLDGGRGHTLLLLELVAFRHDEFASLDLAHLRFDNTGLVVELPKSKINQKGEVAEKASFFAPERRSCLVRAVKDCLEVL